MVYAEWIDEYMSLELRGIILTGNVNLRIISI